MFRERQAAQRSRFQRPRYYPVLEMLEDRTVLSTADFAGLYSGTASVSINAIIIGPVNFETPFEFIINSAGIIQVTVPETPAGVNSTGTCDADGNCSVTGASTFFSGTLNANVTINYAFTGKITVLPDGSAAGDGTGTANAVAPFFGVVGTGTATLHTAIATNLSVSAPNAQYTGLPHPASASATGLGSAAIDGTYFFTYYVGATATGTGSSTAPTNLGTYTVVASFSSQNPKYENEVSDPVTFTITKGTPTITITAGGVPTGNPIPATATALGGDGATVNGTFAFTYFVGTSATGTGSSTPPSALGTYTVKAVFTSQDANYNSVASTVLTYAIAADATPPTSSIDPLPAGQNTLAISLSWLGSDGNGSGIATYSVFVSDNGGPYTAFLTNTTATSGIYTGIFDHHYDFYCVAKDVAGNQQATPAAAQASILLETAAPSSTVAALPDLSPAEFIVEWSGNDGTGSGVAAYDIYYSDNGGLFTLWQFHTDQTAATFIGEDGHTYAFYSVAIDAAGNQELKSTAETSTTVDGIAPESTIAPLPASQDSASIHLSWSGSDADSGIAGYDIYVADNAGAFTRILHNTTATSTTYVGTYGHAYAFYSIAIDNAGNEQPTPEVVQATIGIATFDNAAIFSGGVLRVGGTSADNTIVIAPTKDLKKVQVSINGVVISKTTPVAKVQQIRVFGRDGTDTITISNLFKATYVEGGAGTDTVNILGRATANTFVVSAAGVVANGAAVTLDSAEALVLTGQKVADVLTVQGTPGIPVVFNGGAGLDKVQGGRATGNTWTLTGAAAGNLNGSVTFSAVETLGGTSTQDTLVGANLANTWALSLANAGKVGTLAFTGMENLRGGALADSFVFARTASITGAIDGGAGRNLLNYAAFLTAVNVDLGAGTATAVVGGVDNIADVYGGAGADHIHGDAGANLLIGNAGNDELDGEEGNDTLIGAGGADDLFGAEGRDLLFGGTGVDGLNSGFDDDVLAGSSVTYFNETTKLPNLTALNALLAEWSSIDTTYADRVAHLRLGGGLNGTAVLSAATVKNDAAIDTLLGVDGLDWFLVNAGDVANDWDSATEIKTTL